LVSALVEEKNAAGLHHRYTVTSGLIEMQRDSSCDSMRTYMPMQLTIDHQDDWSSFDAISFIPFLEPIIISYCERTLHHKSEE
jgi:hypothetical protein